MHFTNCADLQNARSRYITYNYDDKDETVMLFSGDMMHDCFVPEGLQWCSEPRLLAASRVKVEPPLGMSHTEIHRHRCFCATQVW